MEEKKLFPFFDCAYQGFASGDLDTDAWSAGKYCVNPMHYIPNLNYLDRPLGNTTLLEINFYKISSKTHKKKFKNWNSSTNSKTCDKYERKYFFCCPTSWTLAIHMKGC
jgi:hypothetical protein